MYFEIKYILKTLAFGCFLWVLLFLLAFKLHNDIIPSFIFEGNISFYIWI